LGQTTQDGKLTLVSVTSISGAMSISLKNNDSRPVIVDSYRLSYSNYNCTGVSLRIPSNASQRVCVVSDASGAGFGQESSPRPSVERDSLPRVSTFTGYPGNIAPIQTSSPLPRSTAGPTARVSLQLYVTWHALARTIVNPGLSPSPFPLPT
jgi:hypothetical protein